MTAKKDVNFRKKEEEKNVFVGELNNLTDIPLRKKFFCDIVKKILEEETKREKINISFAVVEEEEIKKLNKIYRKKNKSTDVLSFFYNEDDCLGEVVLCPQKIKEKMKEDNFKRAFCRTAVHGVLHLLNYDHKNKKEESSMEEKTDYYLKKIMGR